jgi:hypothetical protein
VKPNRWTVFCGGCTALTGLLLYGPIGGLWMLPGAGAIAAAAFTPLGLLNFLVLQWFGVRLCTYSCTLFASPGACRVGERMNLANTTGHHGTWRVAEIVSDTEIRVQRYGVQHWIWPLTGWWTDYRWIARRS